MAWTSPPTFTAGQVVTATDFNNYITNNSLYLLNSRPQAPVLRINGASYTTTSTSFTTVDNTNLSATITISGSRIAVWASCLVQQATGGYCAVDIGVDGTLLGDAVQGSFSTPSVNVTYSASMFRIATALATGSHTVKLYWKASSNTSNMLATVTPVLMFALEV